MLQLSRTEARRIAISSIGLCRSRPRGRSNHVDARGVFADVGLIQIDSVNVLARAQEMPLWARLGDHERSALPSLAEAGELFEYWGHAASLIPVDDEPLFRWRMHRARDGFDTWDGIARLAKEHPGYIEEVHRRVVGEGPITAAALRVGPSNTEPWWGWDSAKLALEYLLWSGEISAVRGKTFERRYDTRERMLPRSVLETPDPTPHDAQKELLRRGAVSHGVGWLKDIADYYRITPTVAKPLLRELVESGDLIEVKIEDHSETAYLSRSARQEQPRSAATLLSPFDPLVWNRERIERLFGFEYRIEIYVPEPKRIYGYYVLPCLIGDRIAARVDLKADRANSCLLVPGAFGEPDRDLDKTGSSIAAELKKLAAWLGLERIKVGTKGDLAKPIRQHLAPTR